MDKWYLRTGGVLLQVCAAIGFILAGESDGASLIFAVPLSVTSLLVFARGSSSTPEPPAPPPATYAPQPRLEEMIIALQEDVSRLREDREFYRELYADGAAMEPNEAARIPGREPALTYRLVPERLSVPRPPSSTR